MHDFFKVEGAPARPDPLPSAIFPDPDRGEGLGPAAWRRVTLYTADALAATPEADRPDAARLRFIAPGVMAGLEVEPRWLVPEVTARPQPTPLESSRASGIRRGELLLERTWWADLVAGCRLCLGCVAQPLGPGDLRRADRRRRAVARRPRRRRPPGLALEPAARPPPADRGRGVGPMTVDAIAMDAVSHARGLLARAVARARSADARFASTGGELLAPRLGAWRDLAWNRVSHAEDDLAEAVATAMMGPGEFRVHLDGPGGPGARPGRAAGGRIGPPERADGGPTPDDLDGADRSVVGLALAVHDGPGRRASVCGPCSHWIEGPRVADRGAGADRGWGPPALGPSRPTRMYDAGDGPAVGRHRGLEVAVPRRLLRTGW